MTEKKHRLPPGAAEALVSAGAIGGGNYITNVLIKRLSDKLTPILTGSNVKPGSESAQASKRLFEHIKKVDPSIAFEERPVVAGASLPGGNLILLPQFSFDLNGEKLVNPPHPGILTHEYGHINNFWGKNGRVALALAMARNPSLLTGVPLAAIAAGHSLGQSDTKHQYLKALGLGSAAGALVGAGITAEEAAASKHGLELLKRLGVKKPVLQDSRDVLRTALKTYKYTIPRYVGIVGGLTGLSSALGQFQKAHGIKDGLTPRQEVGLGLSGGALAGLVSAAKTYRNLGRPLPRRLFLPSVATTLLGAGLALPYEKFLHKGSKKPVKK